MNTKLNKENFSAVLERVRKSRPLDEVQQVEMMLAVARMAVTYGKTEADFFQGKTFNEAILFMKQNIAKPEREKEGPGLASLKNAKEAEDNAQKLSQYLDVLTWKKSSDQDGYGFRKYVTLTLEMENKHSVDIDAFEGEIFVFDKLNNQLGRLGIKSTDIIKAKRKESRTWQFPTISFTDNMKEIYQTPASSLKFKFRPSKILLIDGSEAQ